MTPNPASRASAPLSAAGDVEIRRAPAGAILEVHIGQWRVLTSTDHRRLAEVRELSCGRVAVRIEKLADETGHPASESWQLYTLEGRLEASLHTTVDSQLAILSNYRTRQACRMTSDSQGSLRPVETWRI
jgi:hypothetical protein